MSPRPYRLGQREATSQQTRARILGAALHLLREGDRVTEFSIDAVARRADVVRMTVYYQFGSKRGLLEALFDELAGQGLVERLRAAFGRSDPLTKPCALVTRFEWAICGPLSGSSLPAPDGAADQPIPWPRCCTR
jgi:AcrR family transcriptional regulator